MRSFVGEIKSFREKKKGCWQKRHQLTDDHLPSGAVATVATVLASWRHKKPVVFTPAGHCVHGLRWVVKTRSRLWKSFILYRKLTVDLSSLMSATFCETFLAFTVCRSVVCHVIQSVCLTTSEVCPPPSVSQRLSFCKQKRRQEEDRIEVKIKRSCLPPPHLFFRRNYVCFAE